MKDTTAILGTSQAGPRVIRGGALRIAGYGAGALLSVVAVAALTRHLGPADFGRYAAVFALMTVVQSLTDLGTQNIGVREYALRTPQERPALTAQLIGVRLALALVGGAGAVAVAAALGYRSDQVWGAAAAGAGLLLMVWGGTLTIPLQAELRLGWVTLLELVRQAVMTAGLAALALAGAGLVPLLGVWIPAGAAVLVLAVVLTRGAGRLPSFDPAAWRRLLALSLPYGLAVLAGVLYLQVVVLILSVAAGDDETGLFSAALRVYAVIATVPALIISSALPLLARAARDDRERLAYASQRLFEVIAMLGALAALVLAVAAPVAIDLVAGGEYDRAVGVLRLQAVALFGTFVLLFGSFLLLALGRVRVLLVSNLVGFVVTSVVTLVLAPEHGATGGAIAVIAADWVVAVLYSLALRRGDAAVPVRYAALWPTAVATAAGGGAVLLAGLPALPAAVLATVVFVAVLVVLGAVPPEVRELLRRRGTAHGGG